MGRMKYQRDRYDKTKKFFFEHPDELQSFSLFSVLFSIPLFLTGLSIFVLSLPAHTGHDALMTLLVPTFPQQGRFPVSGEASGYVEFRTCKALPFFSGAGSPSVRRFQLLWHERFFTWRRFKIPGGGGLPPGTGYFGLQRQPEAGRYAGVHRFSIVEGHGKRSTLPFSGCGGSTGTGGGSLRASFRLLRIWKRGQ